MTENLRISQIALQQVMHERTLTIHLLSYIQQTFTVCLCLCQALVGVEDKTGAIDSVQKWGWPSLAKEGHKYLIINWKCCGKFCGAKEV